MIGRRCRGVLKRGYKRRRGAHTGAARPPRVVFVRRSGCWGSFLGRSATSGGVRVTVKVDTSDGRPQVGVPGPAVGFWWWGQGLCAASAWRARGLVSHVSGAEWRRVSLGRSGKEGSLLAIEHAGVALAVLFLLCLLGRTGCSCLEYGVRCKRSVRVVGAWSFPLYCLNK